MSILARNAWASAAVAIHLATVGACRRVEPTSKPEAPPGGVRFEEVSRAEAPFGKPYDVAVAGHRAYVANGAGGLVIVDLSGRDPKVLGRYVTGAIGHDTLGRDWMHEFRGEATAVSVSGRYAFLLTQSKGYDVGRSKVLRLDVSDPARPALAGEYVLTGSANGLAALGETRVCVTRNLGGTFPPNSDGVLSVLDFSDPGRARILGSLPSPRGFKGTAQRVMPGAGVNVMVLALEKKGAAEEAAVWTVSLADPAKPALLASAPGKGEFPSVEERLAPFRQLLRPPAPPPMPKLSAAELGLLDAERATPRALVMKDSVGYLANGRDGLRTLDLSDPKQPRLLGRFYDEAIGRMAANGVKVVGATAYVADLDNGLYLVDVSEPREPRLLSHVHTANAHTVDVSGGLAVVADGVYGAVAIDVSDPRQPRVVGRYHAPGVKFTSAVFQPTADGSLPTIELADAGWVRTFRLRPGPAPDYRSPELVAHLKLPMGIPDLVRVSDDAKTAFMVNDEGWNLIAIDIGDPTRPRVRSVSATSGFAHGLALRGNLAFACNNSDACTIFDMANPDKPVLVSAAMPFNRCARAEVLGDALFLHTADGLVCVDIADVRKPQVKGAYKELWREYAAAERGGRRYVLGAGPGGWHVVDATDLAKPQRAALLPGGFGSTAVQGDLAYVGKDKELLAIQWAEKEPQIVGRVATPEAPGRVAVSGRFAYFGGRVLGVVDISDPKQPKLLGTLKAEFNEGTYGGATGQFTDLRPFAHDGRDYLAAVDHYWGLRLYDASDKAHLKELGDFPTSGGDFTGIQADGTRVYVGNNWGGVYIVDARDPAKPKLAGSTRRLTKPNKGSVGHLAAGERLYLQGNTDRTLRIADVADPANPRLLSEFPLPKDGQGGDNRRFGATFPQLRGRYLYTPGFARVFDVGEKDTRSLLCGAPEGPSRQKTPGVFFPLIGECKEAGFQNDSCALAELKGRLHLVIASQEGLKVVDVSDPRAPRLVGVAPGDHQGGYYFGRGLCVVGATAYVCDRHQVNIVDLSDPKSPRRLSSIEVSGFTCDVKVAGGLAYILGYYGGLHVADVRDPRRPFLVDHFQQGVYWDAAAWDNIACYQCLDVSGGYAYLTEYYSGLHILRLGPAAK